MFGHFIPENKSDSHPSVIVCVDTESTWRASKTEHNKTEHRFRLASVTYCRIEGGKPTRRQKKRFGTVAAFWKWLDSVADRKRPTWLWMHNAAADLVWLNLAAELDGEPPRFSLNPNYWGESVEGWGTPKNWRGFACLADPPTMLKLRALKGWNLNICDSLNWLPYSLDDVGKWVGLDKVPLPDVDAPDHEWYTRCDRDTEILEAAVLKLLKWVKTNDLGMFRWSVAMQSLAAWRHGPPEYKIAPHHIPEVDALERDGYFGGMTDLRFRGKVVGREKSAGRSECFDVEGPTTTVVGPIHELDCTSLYPSLYRSTYVPVQLLDWSIPPVGTPARPKALAEDCVATVCLHTLAEPYPLRAVGGVVWAKGRYYTTLCGVELQRAVAAGVIQEVVRWSQYELKPALRSFGEKCIAGRMKCKASGDVIEEKLWKHLANSLHGKFGQKPCQWVDALQREAPEAWAKWMDCSATTGKDTLYRSIGWDVQRKEDGPPPRHAFPAVPAFITAAAREHLRMLANIAGVWSVLYCCADSLYVTDNGLRRLREAGMIRDNEPGYLRLVRSGDTADFRGIGWLYLGLLKKQSGVPRNARPIGGERVEYDRWPGLEDTLWSGQPDVVVTERMQRAPTNEWWRGEVLSTGWIERLTLPASAASRPELGALYPLPETPTAPAMRRANRP